jgi:NADH:ubiquinone oxidoreductase subunit H
MENNIVVFLLPILAIISVLLPILMVVAFVTIAERKIMGSMQRRCGPNAVGFENVFININSWVCLWKINRKI